MAKGKSSVRIGPISIFTLIILLCLAVLAVLAMSTAHASYASADKQARFTADTYANERNAQNFVAWLDVSLSSIRQDGSADTPEEALAQLSSMLFQDIEVDGTTLHTTFTQESGRTLTVGISINDDLTYTIVEWKATTQWEEDTDIGNLWPGSSQ